MARWLHPLASTEEPNRQKEVRITRCRCNKESMGELQTEGAVSSEAVQEELERILTSTCFRNSTRVSRFLRFTVETTLRAQGEPIKEYLIGVEVFERDSSYDPRLDPVVRVEAGRLRSKLAEYYRTQGLDDSLVIDLPRGTYVPTFSARKPTIEIGHLKLETGNLTDDLGRISSFRLLHRPFLKCLVWISVPILTMMALASAYYHFRAGRRGTRTVPKSIAVLPLRPLNLSGEDSYLGLGLADALITRLSSLGRINVRSVGEIAKYGGLTEDPLAAGRQLRVDFVLDGSIQRVRDTIRVTVRLLNVETNSVLWAAQFDAKFTDIFSLEDSVAQQGAAALLQELTGPEKQRLTKHYTPNIEAYDDYLKARFFSTDRHAEGLRIAIDYLTRAVAKDPGYAQAYAGLADCYALLGFYGFLSPNQSYPKAKAAAMKALQIDETVAEAHASLLSIKTDYDWDWLGAEREFRRAIDLNPNYPPAYQWYGFDLLVMGRQGEAMAAIRRALDLDPVSPTVNISQAWFFYLTRQYNKSVEQCLRTLELHPNFVVAHQMLGLTYDVRGEFGQGIAELQKARVLSPDNLLTIAVLGHAYAASGRRDEAQKMLDQLGLSPGHSTCLPYDVAAIYVGLDRNEEALRWLERAYQERSNWLIYLKLDPRFDRLRSDRRFVDLARRIGLPE
jgi:TolB-like protein/tetratricopeptide (TPR) repeat protein